MFHMTMQLRLPPEIRPLADKGSLTFEYGAFAGRDYGFELRVCSNPCCHCNDVELRCFPTKPSEDAVPSEPFCLMMEIVKRKIILPRQEEQNGARELGKALVQEIAPFHWQLLTDRFMAVKAQISEQDDLTDSEPEFPPEALMNLGNMVGYHEILPYAGRLELASEGRLWLIDEQYCLRYPCSCHAAALTFIRIDEPPELPSASSGVCRPKTSPKAYLIWMTLSIFN